MLILSPGQSKAEAGLGSPRTSALHMAGFKSKGKKFTCQESKRNQPIVFGQTSYVHRFKWSLMRPFLLGIISGLMSSPARSMMDISIRSN